MTSRTKRDRPTGWTRAQVREYARSLRHQVGDGWRYLVPEVQGAMVAERVLYIASGQASGTVNCEDMTHLLVDLRAAMGLEKEGS